MNFTNLARSRSNVIQLHPAPTGWTRITGFIANDWRLTKAHLVTLLPDPLPGYFRYRRLGFPRRAAWFNAKNRIGAGRR